MKRIFENWRATLSEGILEKETTEISRMIVDRIKKLAKAGTMHQSPVNYHWIEVQNKDIPETLKDTALLHSVMVKGTKFDQEKEGIPHGRRVHGSNPVRISGQFAGGGMYRELTLFVRVYMDLVPTPEDFIKSTSEWLPELKNLLRHEIEHARQKTKSDQGKYEKHKATGIGMSGTRKEAVEYFQTKEEKEAYVVGLYKKAKMTKTPFGELLDDWIRTMRFHVKMSNKGAVSYTHLTLPTKA